MKSIFILSITIGLCSVIYGQQEPQYSQYMYNMSTVNSAYVTDQVGMISTGLLYRKQWTGVEGAPQTANVFANIPINEKIELGVNYVNDKIGDAISTNNNFFNIDFAYITQISDKLKLSYGLKTGVNRFSIDAANSNVSKDPVFSNNSSQINFTVGAGLFFFTHNFYFGISSPNLLPNDIKNDNDIHISKSKAHLYGIAGYVFDISDEVKLKPSTAIKQVIESSLTFDVSLNTLLYNKLELGISYRYEEAIVALAGINVMQNLKIGYAYDFGLSDFSGQNSGSHEFIMLYKFDLLSLSNKYTSPRFF